MQKKRVFWIDYCKVFAIFCVILGHMSINSYALNYIFSFHMPLFFFISGYLYHYKGDFLPFFEKNVSTILLPYYYLNILVLAISFPLLRWTASFSIEDLRRVVNYIILGNSRHLGGGTWFLLAMFFTRLVCYFILMMNRKRQIVCLIISIIVSYTFPIREMPLKIDVVFMAIPFYMIGFYCKEYNVIDRINRKIVIAFLCLVLSAIMVYFNGFAEMNLRNFGNYPILYYPLCLISLGTYVLAFSCLKTRNKGIEYLSKGTIVTMAFQGFTNLLIFSIIRFLNIQLPINYNICCIVFWAPLSLMLTLPFIFILKRYFPRSTGNR